MLQDSIIKYSSLESDYSNINKPSDFEPSTKYYIIKKGDTIWDIAQKHQGVSVSDIKKLNTDLDVYHLKTGTKIIIKYP